MFGRHTEVGEVSVSPLDHRRFVIDPGDPGAEQGRLGQQCAGAEEGVDDPVPGGDSGEIRRRPSEPGREADRSTER